MPALLVKEGPHRGAVIEVYGERFAIGRVARGELRAFSAAAGDSEILFRRTQHGWSFERSSDAALTWLNDGLVERARLRHLDEIRVGDCRLVFLDDEADAGPVLLRRFRPSARPTHILRPGEVPVGDAAAAGGVHLPFGVVLDASRLSETADTVGRVLSGAAEAVRRPLAGDVALAVLHDGSELRPVTGGEPEAGLSLEAFGVNTHLVHASLMGGYGAAWADCTPQPFVACAPVRPAERTRAVLYVGRAEGAGEFSRDEVALLMSVAAQAAAAIDHAATSRRLSQRVSSLERQVLERYDMAGSSPAMRAVYGVIERVAPTDAGVLICGETGTGKELVARAIHARSRRSAEALEIVNCAAVPQGLLESELFGHVRGAFTGADADRSGRFELADGGTLVLDEVTEMSPDCQARLLRVLEDARVRPVGATSDRIVDVRVIAITNRDPAAAVAEGRLRSDLFYRLDRFRIALPPLREREGDVALLARHFARACGMRRGRAIEVAEDAAEMLCGYGWPGNVRELKNVIERAVLLCDGRALTADSLPEEVAGEGRLGICGGFQTLEEMERQHVARALACARGNKSLAARLLGIDRTTLYAKLKRFERE